MRPSAQLRRGGTGRRVAIAAAALLVAVAGAACDPAAEPDASGSTTTTPAPTTTVATTTTAAPTTTVPTTTTAPATTTTTTSVPDPPGSGDLTLRDTGLTRVRVTLSNEAEWMYVDLLGTTIRQSRVQSVTGGFEVTALGGDHIAGRGAGQAVIDLVLSVPQGVAPALSMCKNYLGDATATVDRTTTGVPERIATLVNGGRSPFFLPPSCENGRLLSMDRDSMIGPARWPARHDPRPLVLANYYPWYDASELAKPFGDPPIGPADTSDPIQVEAALDLARSSGVDGFVVEYEASPAHDSKIDLVWDAADARPGFQMATMLDFALLAYRGTGLDAAGLDTALAAVAQQADRPSQLEISGQPVVFLYGSERVSSAAWVAALGRLRARTGMRPFVVSEGPALPSDGEYAYGSHQMADEAGLRRWSDDSRSRVHEQPAIEGSPGRLWVAPVSPGYDDSRVRTPATRIDRAGGTRYEQAWDAALDTLPDWILVTSWNEYYEQTHVMPGATTGTRALDQTRARSQRFHITG